LMSLLWIVVIIFMIIGVAASRKLPEPVHRAPSSTAPR
jgi:hypothetical protein